MSTTRQLAERYRAQYDAELKPLLAMFGDKMNTDIDTRRAYWKAHRPMRNKIMPRGKRNFVLRFEGMI